MSPTSRPDKPTGSPPSPSRFPQAHKLANTFIAGGAVLIILGLGMIYASSVSRAREDARRIGREEIISAVGGMYAACTIENPMPIKSTSRSVDKCEALYKAHEALLNAYYPDRKDKP